MTKKGNISTAFMRLVKQFKKQQMSKHKQTESAIILDLENIQGLLLDSNTSIGDIQFKEVYRGINTVSNNIRSLPSEYNGNLKSVIIRKLEIMIKDYEKLALVKQELMKLRSMI